MSWGATVFLDRLDPPNRVFESIYLLRVITGFTQQVFFFKVSNRYDLVSTGTEAPSTSYVSLRIAVGYAANDSINTKYTKIF